MMDNSELRKWKDRMPGEDGAFERFIAAALATILTIVFSWQIIIDVRDVDERRRKRLASRDDAEKREHDVGENSVSSCDKLKASNGICLNNNNDGEDADVAVLSKLPVTSGESSGSGDSNRSNQLTRLVREYKLTASTLSRLETVPDPVELITHSAAVIQSEQARPPLVSVTVLADRRTTGLDTAATVQSSGRDADTSTDLPVLQTDNASSKRRQLATPEDFDSVSLPDDDEKVQEGEAGPAPKKRTKMFEESWDMEHSDDDFAEIYGDAEGDRNNPRDFFFVPVEHDSSADDDDDHYWPRRILEVISEEDEDDLSDSEGEIVSDDENDRFSDDSLDIDEGKASYVPSKGITIKDCIEVSPELVSPVPSPENAKDYFGGLEAILNIDNNAKNSYSFTDSPLGPDSGGLDRNHDNRIGDVAVFTSEFTADAGARSEKFTREHSSPERASEFANRSTSPTSPAINEGLRALCASSECLNDLEPSLSSCDSTEIVAHSYQRTSQDKHSMDSYSEQPSSPFCNGINISNFNDSALEYLEDSYRDCELSDCSQPAPRGFIFSETTEDATTDVIVSTNIVPRVVDSKQGVHVINVPGVDANVGDSSEPISRSVLSATTAATASRDSSSSSGRVDEANDSWLHDDSSISNLAPVVESDGVYILDTGAVFIADINSDLNSHSDKRSEEKPNFVSKLEEEDSKINQVSLELCIATESVFKKLPDRAKICESPESPESASSGDESSTTTGDTAILNPRLSTKTIEITDDDISEISEIDYDVITDLQRAIAQPHASVKHQVTDLDASDDDDSSQSENLRSCSESDSESEASFEINTLESPVLDTTIGPLSVKRNLHVLDELEEDEDDEKRAIITETSSDEENFEDAIDGGRTPLKITSASESSSSQPSSPTEDLHVNTEYLEPLLEKHFIDDAQVGPVHTAHSETATNFKLSISPYFATEVNLTYTDDKSSQQRTIVRRHRHYSDMAGFPPEVGFFQPPEFQDAGVQTVRSYRQPAACTIDPERYFRPFSVETTFYDVSTEYSTGEIEVLHYADVGVQVRFDPLWDKTEQQLVLSPCTTPTRGSPVTVSVEGKLAPKELIFQWPEVDNDNVFSSGTVEPRVNSNASPLRKISFDKNDHPRRPSYEVIDESEEFTEENTTESTSAQPINETIGAKYPNIITSKAPDNEILKTESVSEDEPLTALNTIGQHGVQPTARSPSIRAQPSKLSDSSSFKSHAKLAERLSSDSTEEENFEMRRSPRKRRARKSKSPPASAQIMHVAFDKSLSSSDECRDPTVHSAQSPTVEKIHIEDSSDADDEDEVPPTVTSVLKSAESSTALILESAKSTPIIDSKTEISVAITPKNQSQPFKETKKDVLITVTSIAPVAQSPAVPVKILPEQLNVKLRPVPTARTKPVDLISSVKVNSTIEPTPTPLYNEFNRPVARISPTKDVTVSANETTTNRVKTALSVNLATTLTEPQLVLSSEVKAIPPVAPKKSEYVSVLAEPVLIENRNISHLFTLPEKAVAPEIEKIVAARKQYMHKKPPETSNEEERKKLLSRLLGTRDWSEREMPKPRSILKKTTPAENKPKEEIPLGYKPTSLDTPGLAKLCKSTENIVDRITQVVNRRKEEDRERSLSRTNSRTDLDRKSFTLPADFGGAPWRAKSLDSLMENKSLTLSRSSESSGFFRLVRSPSMCLNKSPLSFFSDRKSYTNLLETDIDSNQQKAVPLIQETDLDEASKNASTRSLYRTRSKSETREPGRPVIKDIYNDGYLARTKSMELLSEKHTIQLSVYGGTPEVVTAKKDNNRLSRSLGQLDLPDWYVNALRKPEDIDFGLKCTKTPPSSNSTSFEQSRSFRFSTNTSFETPRSTIITTRVSPPRSSPSQKSISPKDFVLPSERFRRDFVPLSSRKIVSKMQPPGTRSMENLTSKELSTISSEDNERKIHNPVTKPDKISPTVKDEPKTNETNDMATRGVSMSTQVQNLPTTTTSDVNHITPSSTKIVSQMWVPSTNISDKPKAKEGVVTTASIPRPKLASFVPKPERLSPPVKERPATTSSDEFKSPTVVTDIDLAQKGNASSARHNVDHSPKGLISKIPNKHNTDDDTIATDWLISNKEITSQVGTQFTAFNGEKSEDDTSCDPTESRTTLIASQIEQKKRTDVQPQRIISLSAKETVSKTSLVPTDNQDIASKNERRNTVEIAKQSVVGSSCPPVTSLKDNSMTFSKAMSAQSERPDITKATAVKETKPVPRFTSGTVLQLKPAAPVSALSDNPPTVSRLPSKVQPTFNNQRMNLKDLESEIAFADESEVPELTRTLDKEQPIPSPSTYYPQEKCEPITIKNETTKVMSDHSPVPGLRDSPTFRPSSAEVDAEKSNTKPKYVTSRKVIPVVEEVVLSPSTVRTDNVQGKMPRDEDRSTVLRAPSYSGRPATSFENSRLPEISLAQSSIIQDNSIHSQKISESVKPVRVVENFEQSETKLRLQAPVVQAATQPHQPKSFATTPAHFYALNCIETDLDTSATMSPPPSKSPDSSTTEQSESSDFRFTGNPGNYMRIAVDDLSSAGSGSESHGSDKGLYSKNRVDIKLRSAGRQEAQRPRMSTFGSKPQAVHVKKAQSQFVTRRSQSSMEDVRIEPVMPSSTPPLESTIDPVPSNTVSPNLNAPSSNYQVKLNREVGKSAPVVGTNRSSPPPLIRGNNRTRQTVIETSVEDVTARHRNEVHLPPNHQAESPPIHEVHAPRTLETDIDAELESWKSITPIARTQPTQDVRSTRTGLGSFVRSLEPAKETGIDVGFMQQNTHLTKAFERTLDNDSFRFDAPQSSSSPLNLSMESNSSITFRAKLGRTVNRSTSKVPDIDDKLPIPPPRREIANVPPVPYRPPRPAVAPPVITQRNGSSDYPPRNVGHVMETDIDGDLNGPTIPPRVILARSVPESPRNSIARAPDSRPGSIASHAGSISDGCFESDLDLDTFKRMAREDPLVSTSSPRASPLDARMNTFGTCVRIDHSQAVYHPQYHAPTRNNVNEDQHELDSPHNTSLVEVLDGLLGMDSSISPRSKNSDDSFTDITRKRTISEAKFDLFSDIQKRLNEHITMIRCRNSRCGKTVPMKQARTSYVSCSLCYCYYCCSDCRSKHYIRHESRCTFARVEAACKLVSRRFSTDPQLSHQITGVARTGFVAMGRGCVLVKLDSLTHCEQVLTSGRTALRNSPSYCPMDDFDSEPAVADGSVDACVEYNPHSNLILNVAVFVQRRAVEIVKYCEQLPLNNMQATPSVSINDRQPREQWLFDVQNKLRERGVDLRRQYPDVYNQIIQYVDRRLPFSPITIYPVDGNTGRTFLCSISPEVPIDIRPMTWSKPYVDRQVYSHPHRLESSRSVPNTTAKETEL